MSSFSKIPFLFLFTNILWFWFVCLFWFYGISTFVGYLTPNPFLCKLSVLRSTTSQILTIRRILEGVRAKKLQATLIFVDFTKAFDSIHRGKMEQIRLAYGIPKETEAAITIFYRNTKVKVRSPDGDTEYFDIVARGHASSVPLYHLSRLRT